MTLAEAVAVLQVFANRHPDGSSWTRGDYLQVDYWAPEEADADTLTNAVHDLDEAARVVLGYVATWEAQERRRGDPDFPDWVNRQQQRINQRHNTQEAGSG